MPFLLLGCLGLFFPRIVILLLWLFTGYLGHAFSSALWPVLGFFFAPFTTLGYAVAQNEGQMHGFWVAFLVIGILLDLGVLGGGAKSRRKART